MLLHKLGSSVSRGVEWCESVKARKCEGTKSAKVRKREEKLLCAFALYIIQRFMGAFQVVVFSFPVILSTVVLRGEGWLRFFDSATLHSE